MQYLAKRSILAFPCAKFSTRVDLDLPLRFFVLRPLGCFDDTTQTILVSFRAGVLCQDLGIQDLAPVSHKCTRVWLGVDSGVPVRKQTRHHVARVAREGILLWILAKLPVHAPCLNWSRFGRSGQKANTASCVYTAMREGMRYKVYLLLQGRVVHPVMDMDRAPRACTVSGLESFEAFPSGSSHGIIWYFAPRRA